MFRRTAFAAPLALLCCAVSAHAQTVLTAERVLELAERQNPDVLVARTRTVQAEGVLTTAQVRLPANPEVDAFFGSRDNAVGGRTGEYQFSFLQRVVYRVSGRYDGTSHYGAGPHDDRGDERRRRGGDLLRERPRHCRRTAGGDLRAAVRLDAPARLDECHVRSDRRGEQHRKRIVYCDGSRHDGPSHRERDAEQRVALAAEPHAAPDFGHSPKRPTLSRRWRALFRASLRT